MVVLTDDGRLSAKEFIGNRSKMRDDQSSYAESRKKLRLERGIEGSHTIQFSTTTNHQALECLIRYNASEIAKTTGVTESYLHLRGRKFD